MKAYCDANKLTNIDPQRFHAYCDMKNWMYEGKPMNWQAVATFLHNRDSKNDGKGGKTVSAQNYTQREYDSEFYDSFYSDLYDEARKL